MASSSSSTASSCSSAASVRGRRMLPFVMLSQEMVPLTSETRFCGDGDDGDGDGVSRGKRR
jgi:hypothetical protein